MPTLLTSLGRFCRLHYPSLVLLSCALTAVLAVMLIKTPSRLDGPILDVMVWARSNLFGSDGARPESSVAVIAVDERSLGEPELAPYPRALLSPVWAEVVQFLVRADVRAIGFDFILSYSANRWSADYDRPFLATLSRHRDRIVLARSATNPPARPFQAALRFDPGAVGIADIASDADGTYRRVAAGMVTEQGGRVVGFAHAVLRRAGVESMPEQVVVAPRFHLEQLPTYAIVDVLRCGEAAPEVLHAAFAGKIVLIGSTLPEDDRKWTAGKYLAPPVDDGPLLHACGLRRLAASVPSASTVPGVFLHAAAIEAVVSGNLVATASSRQVAAVSAFTAVAGAALGLLLAAWYAAVAVAIGLLVVLGASVTLLEFDLWFPAAIPSLSLLVAPFVAYVVRYQIEEKSRQRVQKELSFLSGLPRWMLDRMAAGDTRVNPETGPQEVTVMFADLSGFTKMSTQVSPDQLAARCSQYLAVIVKQVEETGGWVNQFIGDCVMAIWGAPVPDDSHGVRALRAALQSVARIEELREEGKRQGQPTFDIKIGLNSGLASVGKLGAAERGTYTAAGETVNLAARLESVPALYACKVIMGPRTAEHARERYVVRELDTIRVKGIERPVTIYEPLGECPPSAEQHARVERYAEALKLYRAASFAEAARAWEGLASSGLEPTIVEDGQRVYRNPAMVMARRAKMFVDAPPQGEWSGVWELTGK